MIKIVPLFYYKKFNEIIKEKYILIYILSVYLKEPYQVIKDKIIIKEYILLKPDILLKINVSNYKVKPKINKKYLEINFILNSNMFAEDFITVESFYDCEIHYINVEIILKNIYSKTKVELTDFEKLIIILSTNNKKELKGLCNRKMYELINKRLKNLDESKLKKEYIKYINDSKVDFDYYKYEIKKELINLLKIKLLDYKIDKKIIEDLMDL